MGKKANLRDSGVELLRLAAALAVVMLHYNDGRAFVYAESGSAHQSVLYFLESISICAVDLFVLISGYYLSCTQKRSILKPIELIAELIIIRLLFFVGPLVLKHGDFSLKSLLSCFIPNNYYVVLYCALYLISPYLNNIFQGFENKQWKQFLLIAVLLFSVWNTVVDVFEEIIGSEIMGLSTVTAWGSKQGFNILNFCLLYSIGAFLRYYPLPLNLSNRKKLLVSWCLTIACIFAWACLCRRFQLHELRSAWVYHNPLVILSAVLLFLLFRSFTFKSKVINRLSAASFTCFLVHGTILNYAGIKEAVSHAIPLMLVHIAIVLIGVYCISWIIHEIYHFAVDWLFCRLKKRRLFQPRIIGKKENHS